MCEEPKKTRTVAFLGPLGTYSHQAAYDHFGSSVEYHESGTITDVFDAVASKATDAGVVPQENSIFGSVIETYDALRRGNVGAVQGEIVLEVQHCLLARRGVKREDIRSIKSHEQALGQCRGFLAQNFPAAYSRESRLHRRGSGSCTGLPHFCGLSAPSSVLRCLTASRYCSKEYKTGIATLRVSTSYLIVSCRRRHRVKRACLVRLASRTENGTASPISQLLAALGMTVSRLDRRPQLDSTIPFHDVYFAGAREGGRCVVDVGYRAS
ncbi:Prephenate dehydratase-domain-containing protein [Mycena vulgaris]|nr:Prephenate dehydratase-domain-containing protein [Mycena vulgaris]